MIAMPLDTLKEKYRPGDDRRRISSSTATCIRRRKCFGLDYNDLIKFSLYIFQRASRISGSSGSSGWSTS